jgi:glucokinase
VTDLLADIGGTNARVAFRAGIEPIGRVYTRRSADFVTLSALLQDVITEHGTAPMRGALAVAGPVMGDHIRLTNLPWAFSASELAVQLGLSVLHLENDVAAIAWSLPGVVESDCLALTPEIQSPEGAKLVIAPGTGLGIAGLIPGHRPGRWIAVPGEGGHAFAALSPVLLPEERAALSRSPRSYSWEDLISGIGLPHLYGLMEGAAGATAEDINARAARGESHALRTLALFARLLGACAGDMALILGASGGCYIGGGLVAALGALFDPALFIAGFRAKDRFTDYVTRIPIYLLKNQYTALAGLAARLDQQD